MHSFLKTLADGETLSQADAADALRIIMRGEAAPEEIAAFLLGLRARGETLDELVAFTRVMREVAVSVRLDDPRAVDLCGTGGDHRGTFNVSTAAALVSAGAGVTVAKHGNRSVSSQCGSADVLEALGVRVELGKEGVEYCLEKAGIAFLFAPQFHPAMRHVMPVRKKLGVRTFFNVLGPLCNPAGVRRQLVGAFDVETARTMANVLTQLEADHVMTVHAEDGMDEISISADTTAFEFARGAIPGAASSVDREDASGSGSSIGREDASGSGSSIGRVDAAGSGSSIGRVDADGLASMVGWRIRPEDFGLRRTPIEALRGGTAVDNARMLHSVFEGEPGPRRDVVVLNAAFALHVSGSFDDVPACVQAARESIDSGAALERLRRLVEASQRAPA